MCTGNVMNSVESTMKESSSTNNHLGSTLDDFLISEGVSKIYIVFQYGYDYSILLKAFYKREDAQDLVDWHRKHTHKPTYIEEVELC